MSNFKIIQVLQNEYITKDNLVVNTKAIWLFGCFLIYWEQKVRP